MIVLFALAVGALFAAGSFLLLERDLLRMAAGVLLLSQSANLFLMASGLLHGKAPIHPVLPGEVSDPLVQALTLTAVVITFGVTALLLALVLRVQATHGTIDAEDVVAAEEEAERQKEEGA